MQTHTANRLASTYYHAQPFFCPCMAILFPAIKRSINIRMVDLTTRPAADKPSLLRLSANIFLPPSAYSIRERRFARTWVRLLWSSSWFRIFLTPAVMWVGYRKTLSQSDPYSGMHLNLISVKQCGWTRRSAVYGNSVCFPRYKLTLPVRTCRVTCLPANWILFFFFFSQLFTSSFNMTNTQQSLNTVNIVTLSFQSVTQLSCTASATLGWSKCSCSSDLVLQT